MSLDTTLSSLWIGADALENFLGKKLVQKKMGEQVVEIDDQIAILEQRKAFLISGIADIEAEAASEFNSRLSIPAFHSSKKEAVADKVPVAESPTVLGEYDILIGNRDFRGLNESLSAAELLRSVLVAPTK